ncbi:MFS transporter [Flexivirga meconopsidis]|uniref:MFS transporter n=1 Tax=Flexivirga meconopsidis TaxID=2977121 RepID=UPI002240877C
MGASSRQSSALVLAALASGFVMASVDATVVNVAAVDIGKSLQSSLSEITWVVDVYVLTFASLLLLGGALATAYGSRRLYLVGMVVFLVASVGCALAPDEASLIAARAVEGAGAALFMPSSLALLVGMFTEPAQRARMLGLWSAMVATSAAVGPSIGGILVGAFGWRSIFLINIPVVIIGILLTTRVIPSTTGTGRRVSPVGNLLFFLAVAAGSFVLIQGHTSGFDAPPIRIAVVLLVSSAVVLAIHQRQATDPVMPWRLFGRRSFSGVNVVGFLYSAALYGCLYLMGLFFQNARHVSAVEAGLQLLPMTVCFPLGNLVYTKIHHRWSNSAIMAVCLGLAGIATALLLPVDPSTPYWYLAIALGLANSGAGLVTASMTAAIVQAAGDEHANHAGAVLNTNRQLGTLVGVAVIGLVLQSTEDWYRGLHVALGLVAAVYLLASLTAAATHPRRMGSPVGAVAAQAPAKCPD